MNPRRVMTRAGRSVIAAGVLVALASGCYLGDPTWSISVRNDCDVALVMDSQDSGWEDELAPGEVYSSIGIGRSSDVNGGLEDRPTAELWFKIRLPGSDTQVGVFIAEPSDYLKDTTPGADNSAYIPPIGGDACP